MDVKLILHYGPYTAHFYHFIIKRNSNRKLLACYLHLIVAPVFRKQCSFGESLIKLTIPAILVFAGPILAHVPYV